MKKSQYVTQVFINGHDVGTSVACYTPVEFRATQAIIPGQQNEILVRVGDRTWLPSEAAGGTDKEKEHYLPGIWDDVLLSFTGELRINKLLVLPSVAGKKVTVKIQVRSFKPAQIFYGDPMADSATLLIKLKEKQSGSEVAHSDISFLAKRDNLTQLSLDIALNDFKECSPVI